MADFLTGFDDLKCPRCGRNAVVTRRDDGILIAHCWSAACCYDWELEKEKARSEDRWRSRTYLFSIGSSILTAAVTLGVAMIARPSPSKSTLNLDSVRFCRDSLRRLPTLAQLQNQTVPELSSAINRHVQDCDGILEALLTEAAKRDTK